MGIKPCTFVMLVLSALKSSSDFGVLERRSLLRPYNFFPVARADSIAFCAVLYEALVASRTAPLLFPPLNLGPLRVFNREGLEPAEGLHGGTGHSGLGRLIYSHSAI